MARILYHPPPPTSVNTGASILTFSISPQWGDVYFLLGKERHNIHWPEGSGKWSDFGGARKVDDKCPEETAAREFLEETCASVKYFKNDRLPLVSHKPILQSLLHKQYTFKFYISYNEVDSEHFVVFVKQIPWDPECVYRFYQTRQMLQNARVMLNSHEWMQTMKHHPAVQLDPYSRQVKVNRDFLEKMELWWWSLEQLRHARDSNGVLRKGEECRLSFVEVVNFILEHFDLP